jgi:hypothetical protein
VDLGQSDHAEYILTGMVAQDELQVSVFEF